MRARRLRGWLGLTALLCLSGCSMTQLAYNRLDLIVRWEVSDYLRLDPVQQARFDSDFATLWAWHREKELPLYAEELRSLAAALERPQTRAELEALLLRARARQAQVLERAADIACALGPQLDEAQVTELLSTMAEAREDYAQTAVEPSEARQRRDHERELLQQLRRWLGDITTAQHDLIMRWSAERPLVNAPWLEAQRQFGDAVAAALEVRQQPDFCMRIRPLIVDRSQLWPPDLRAVFAANQAQWLNLTEALQPSLTAPQRRHLHERLLELAEDFEALAADSSLPRE